MKKKGYTTAVAMWGTGMVLAGLVSYFTTIQSTNEKIAIAKETIQTDISADRERLSAVEANGKNLNDWLTRIEKKLDTVIAEKNGK